MEGTGAQEHAGGSAEAAQEGRALEGMKEWEPGQPLASPSNQPASAQPLGEAAGATEGTASAAGPGMGAKPADGETAPAEVKPQEAAVDAAAGLPDPQPGEQTRAEDEAQAMDVEDCGAAPGPAGGEGQAMEAAEGMMPGEALERTGVADATAQPAEVPADQELQLSVEAVAQPPAKDDPLTQPATEEAPGHAATPAAAASQPAVELPASKAAAAKPSISKQPAVQEASVKEEAVGQQPAAGQAAGQAAGAAAEEPAAEQAAVHAPAAGEATSGEPAAAALAGEEAAATQAPAAAGEEEVAAAQVALAPPGPPAPIIPGFEEDQHPLKPQWRRGYSGATTEFLMVTVTQGDVNSRRMRPPRQWYDLLMGGAFGVFEVEVDMSGEPSKFYPQAHAYEYCKSEYYVQGSECKRLYKALELQPGDGLVFRRGEPLPTGMPTTRLTLLRAADNPHAIFVLNSASTGQARRAAVQADPNRRRTPKKAAGAGSGGAPGMSRKRKMAPVRAATDGMPSSYTPDMEAAQLEGGRAKRSVRSRRFPYGEDFVTGQKQFWDRDAAAAAAAEQEAEEGGDVGDPHGTGDVDMGVESDGGDAAISDDSRQAGGWLGPGGGSPSRRRGAPAAAAAAKPPPKSPLLAVAAAAQVHEARRASPEKPRVTAMNIEGRNVLRIKLPFKRPGGQGQGVPVGTAPAQVPTAAAGQAGPSGAGQPAAGAAAAAGAGAGAAAGRGGEGKGPGAAAAADALDSLVALAEAAEDGMDTGRAAHKGTAPGRGEVTLLSKSLTRDGEGRVVGAALRLGWEKEKTAFSAITHQLSEYGATHHDLATVEDFEVQPAENQLRVTLRVGEPGRVDLLEKAVQQLVSML